MSRIHTVFVFLVLLLHAAVPARAEALRFGILPVLDTLPLQVGVAEGHFAEAGVDLELVPFMSAIERDTAVKTGRLDGYFGDLLAACLLAQAGADHKVVTVSYRTTPGQRMFGLVAGPGKKAKAEAGETLTTGLSFATIMEYLLDRINAQAGYSIERVEVKKMPIRLQMLLTGQTDAAMLPEPLATLVESKGGAILATDQDLDEPLTVLCLSEKVMDRKDAFLKAYRKAVADLNAQPEKYRALMAETCRIPPPLADSFPVMAYPEPAAPTEAELWNVQQWMLTRGLLHKTLDHGAVVAR